MDCVKLMESLSLGNSNSSDTDLTFYKSVCVKINDIETDIVYSDHTDKLFIAISQYQKLGTLLLIKKEQVQNLDNFGEVVYTVKPFFGKEDLTQQAAARFLAEKLNSEKDICMFICLKNYNQDTLKAIAPILNEIKASELNSNN